MTLVAYPLVFLVYRRLLLRAPPQRPSQSRCGWHLLLDILRLPLHGLSSHLALKVLLLFLIILSKSHIGAHHGRLLVIIVQVLLLEHLTLLALILYLNLLVIVVIIACDHLFLNEWLFLARPPHPQQFAYTC